MLARNTLTFPHNRKRWLGCVLIAAGILALSACSSSSSGPSPNFSADGGAPRPVEFGDKDKDKDKGKDDKEFNTETYDRIRDNPFLAAATEPLSTFSIDVDTASYSNTRRFLQQGRLPPKDAVRIEEMVNYFPYRYAQPQGNDAFATHVEVSDCPWNSEHRLVRIGLKGKEIPLDKRPACNLVFLIDVSGSMSPSNRLPLVKQALALLVEQLTAKDHVSIVVYAGASGLVLPPTPGDHTEAILASLERLQAGGSTNGGSGIQLAYKVAAQFFVQGGSNRVVLCTDGDFNVGVTNQGDLSRLIVEKAQTGVFLTVLGFGMGNYKDSTLEKLADEGNGNYAYIDSLNEARKVLCEQMAGTLLTIAKDVKIQVEFNPARVSAYRLVGYENRLLRHQDFNDDKKDAGDIGSGHTVTAFYEIVPAGKKINVPGVDPLKYQTPGKPTPAARSEEILTLKLRHKEPDGQTSKLQELPVLDRGANLKVASDDFRFAAAVAAFGMLLRDSPYKGDASFAKVLEWARSGMGPDPNGHRAEFLQLVEKASQLSR